MWLLLAGGSLLAWRFGWDADHHTMVEALSTQLAAMAAALAIVRYSVRRRRVYLLVAVGFVGTTLMDLHHAVGSVPELAALMPSAFDRLNLWSWLASRMYLGVFVVLIGWQLLREKRGVHSRVSARVLMLLGLVGVFAAQALFSTLPLGPAQVDGFVARPQEFVAGALMLWGTTLALRARPWKPVSFVPWLVTAFVLGAVGQLCFAPFSQALFDAPFRLAHVFRITSYAAVVVGLMYSARAAFRAEAELTAGVQEERRRLAEILWSTDVGTWEWDLRTNKVVVNDRLAALVGRRRDDLEADISALWRENCHPDDVDEAMAALQDHLDGKTAHYQVEFRLRHVDGAWVWILDRGKVVERAGHGEPVRMSGTYQDITARKVAEALAARQRDMLARDVATLQSQGRALARQADELAAASERHRSLAMELQREVDRRARAEERERHRAQHDPLTDLPNRRFLTRLGERAVREAGEQGGSVAVLFVDIDGFKGVNDTLGHAAGDLLLVAIAARLQARVRGGDVVARVGGDEFVVLLARDCTVERAGALAAAIAQAIGEPFDLRGHRAQVGASVGVAMYPEHGLGFEDLLRSADTAMYAIKKGRKGGWQLAVAPAPPLLGRSEEG